jgi:diacylglycerol kinase (ATP)
MKSKHSGIKRILLAFRHSFDGLAAAFESESAFRQDLFVCAAGVAALFFIPLEFWERLALGSSLVFILLAELTNTAIESVVDRIGDEYNDLSKKAKDIGSAIVLTTFASVIALWILILY